MFNHEKKSVLRSLDILRLVSIGMLFWAVADNPFLYFQAMRWVVCITTALLCVQAYRKHNTLWMWVFAIMCVLFNPVDQFHLAREAWRIIDVVCGLLLAASIHSMRQRS